ncbi:hypothetical protein AMTRI_Chr04g184880 [Amborella trichopoda]|uniref:UBX domain-containing protein n=1 Tax=Amborella trichopoda TaxID=13333 RepID=W1NL49_AMBTC|nr:plant UBX domain-containing protein 2 [Amborella trichopoda]ERM95945.1 hypothetical protein AMTR_s00060p00199420 [Amborella trichopoda]|eukprot:XP_006828529.1 plant UBX domain-containing protein 2 [Amborella trichopoda]
MGDMKDKVKGFMKKVNNPFSSSSSGKFKGQGRVLGSSSSSSSPSPHHRNPPNIPQKPKPPTVIRPDSKPKVTDLNHDSEVESIQNGMTSKFSLSSHEKSPESNSSGFDPFSLFISSGQASNNRMSENSFECPVCGAFYKSENEVTMHIETCLNESKSENLDNSSNLGIELESRNRLIETVGAFLSGEPSEQCLDVVLKLLKNIMRDPSNAKFRRIRMSNPKIQQSVGSAVGGVELLESVGFGFEVEGDDTWASMESPSDEQIALISEAISLLEPKNPEIKKFSSPEAPNKYEDADKSKKVIDRQVRVFFSTPESVAARIELPESFYILSAGELNREADLRRKKLAESQLLIPKSYKEKQAKSVKKRYKAAVIRIQFPDGVVLQGVFFPGEPTLALYEFVSSALKEPSLEFDLLQCSIPKSRTIPRFPKVGERNPTLEDEDLVPTSLVKFKPIETDSVVFTGLRNELLETSEPISASASLS